MKKITHVYSGVALCALSLALAGCLPEEENGNNNHSTVRQTQLVGGASGVCSSAAQGACEDWNAWATANLTEAERDNSAVAVTDPVILSEIKIDALVSHPSWDSDPDFKVGVEKILKHLLDETADGGFADWQAFRAAFTDVRNSDVDGLPEGVDGDVIWFDSTSAQYATFEGLKKANELLNYTVTANKITEAKNIIPHDHDQSSELKSLLDALQADSAQSIDDLLGAMISADDIPGFANGLKLWFSLDDELRFRLLEELVDDVQNYQRPIEYVSLEDTRNRDSVTIIEDFIAQAKVAGNTETPNILVMTSSAANSYEAADYYVGMFTHEGATAEWLPLDRAYRRARDSNQCDWLGAFHSAYSFSAHLDLLYPDYFSAHLNACENGLAAMIANADGIFINGGDQVRTFDALVTFNDGNRVESAELKQILERHAAGELVIGGTSAGAAVQAGGKLNASANTNPMITAGSPHGILKSGYTANSAELTGGMGVFNFGVTDTHFSERARETRLIRLVEHGGVRFGFGVDETTALNVRHENGSSDEERVVMTVSGRSGVYIVDYGTATTIASAPFDARNVTTHYLNAGDSFIWFPATETYVIEMREDRTELEIGHNSEVAVSSDDILYQTEYLDMATEMFIAGVTEAVGISWEDDPEYTVTLKTTENTRAFQSGGTVSYTYVEVELSHDNNY